MPSQSLERHTTTQTLLNFKKARFTSGLFYRKPTTEMSAFYDRNVEKLPKIQRPQFGKKYDVKKSAYKLGLWRPVARCVVDKLIREKRKNVRMRGLTLFQFLNNQES